MLDAENKGHVVKDAGKASADTAALGHYTKLCPIGCSLLKITRQQKKIPVLGYLSEPPGFLEPAGTPRRLCPVGAHSAQDIITPSAPFVNRAEER